MATSPHVRALGVVQRVGDRHAHVRVAEVGERGAVVQVHDGVDDRLRVHHHADALVGHAEEVMGLDQLEPLVHQRRRVDGDLAAHLPGRVGERLLAGHPLELLRAPAAEGPAAGREDEALDAPGALGADQLVEGRMLGVDRNHPRARGFGQRGDELTADHEALLVGEGQVDPLAEGRDRRPESGRPDERVEDEVAVRARDQLDEALGPGEHPASGPALGGVRGGRGIGKRDPAHAMACRLLEQQLEARVGAESHDLELRAALDHLERLRPDRAGAADDDDPGHRIQSREGWRRRR